MNRHSYISISDKRFHEIKKLAEQMQNNYITPDDFEKQVSEKERADYRVQAQLKIKK